MQSREQQLWCPLISVEGSQAPESVHMRRNSPGNTRKTHKVTDEKNQRGRELKRDPEQERNKHESRDPRRRKTCLALNTGVDS